MHPVITNESLTIESRWYNCTWCEGNTTAFLKRSNQRKHNVISVESLNIKWWTWSLEWAEETKQNITSRLYSYVSNWCCDAQFFGTFVSSLDRVRPQNFGSQVLHLFHLNCYQNWGLWVDDKGWFCLNYHIHRGWLSRFIFEEKYSFIQGCIA